MNLEFGGFIRSRVKVHRGTSPNLCFEKSHVFAHFFSFFNEFVHTEKAFIAVHKFFHSPSTTLIITFDISRMNGIFFLFSLIQKTNRTHSDFSAGNSTAANVLTALSPSCRVRQK